LFQPFQSFKTFSPQVQYATDVILRPRAGESFDCA
jgi:hypothetical protein